MAQEMIFVASKYRIKVNIDGYVIDGNFVPPPNGQPYVPDPDRIGGYKITPIPKDIWDRWFVGRADASYLTQGLIHADIDRAKLETWCREHASVQGGMKAATISQAGNGSMTGQKLR